MLSVILIEALLILLMLFANGIFAMSEMAIVSARKARLEQRAEQGDAGARAALELAQSPNRFLSTVQIGITLIGILAGAFGGATIAEEIEAMLLPIPWIAPYSEAIGVGVVVLVTTYLSLIIGELVPKRLALNSAERVAAAVARPMQILSALAKPAVVLLTASTDFVVRLLGVQPPDEPPITEAEIDVLIEQGIRAGVFLPDEQDIVARVFRLDRQRVSAVMTPRTDVMWLDVRDSIQEACAQAAASGHATFPVGNGSLDNVLGMVSVKALWQQTVQERPADLRAALAPALFVPENVPVLALLKQFQETGRHSALVVSEHGGIEGLVTLTDIMEAIVGHLPSPEELSEEPEIVARADGSWLVDGMLPVDDFKEHFEIKALPDEDRGNYQTVGGFVMAFLDRIPSVADQFEWERYSFEVIDMDGHRVDKVLVKPAEQPVNASDEGP